MAWYFMVDTYIDEENGRGEYEEYIKGVKPIVESYHGKYLIRSENVYSLCDKRDPQRVILIKFDRKEDLDACFSSTEYQAIMSKRVNNVDSRAIIVEGILKDE